MKKILITVRHPGPAQTIAAIIPFLAEYYDRVILVASDAALLMLQERFSSILSMVDLYYRGNGRWTLYDGRWNNLIKGDIMEYSSENDCGFLELIEELAILIQSCQADVVLRTTPALNWGVDEAVILACVKKKLTVKCCCYQEDYGCGVGLEQVPNSIAVIDLMAKKYLEKRNISAIVIGVLNQNLFKKFRPYQEARRQTRKKLGIVDREIVVLYCMGASGDKEAEMEHFLLFLESIGSQPVFLRFHPRNTEEERSLYREISYSRSVRILDDLSYDGALSFSDYLVSAASAMNQDALQYQIFCGQVQLKTLSIYTQGAYTRRILESTTISANYPASIEGMGSKIIAEDHLKEEQYHVEDEERNRYSKEAEKRFGIKIEESIRRFYEYLNAD